MSHLADLRTQCVLKFIEVEQKLREHFLADVVPDWETSLCLVKVAAIDFEEMRTLAALTGPQFNVLRWQHTLESMAKCKDIEAKKDFRMCDLGVLLLLQGGSWRTDLARLDFALDLFRLHELRADCFELNGEFNESRGDEILAHLQEFTVKASRYLLSFHVPASLPGNVVRFAA